MPPPAPPQPPAPPAPPDIFRIVETPPPAKKGFLYELLGGDFGPLYYDAVEHPERYDSATIRLLDLLAARQTSLEKLSPEDMTRINEAAGIFASEVSRPVPREAVKARPPAKHHHTLDADELSGEDLFAGTEVPTFWWTK